jgi:hypothetical protein
MGRSHNKNSITVEQFFWFGREMLESPAFRQLSLSALRCYHRIGLELLNHAGKHNGRLPVTYDDFEQYGVSRKQVAPAIRELVALGIVEITVPGKSSAGEDRFPNHFRITDRDGVDRAGNRVLQTNEWKRIKTDEQAQTLAREARKPPKKARRKMPKKIIFPRVENTLVPGVENTLEIQNPQCGKHPYGPRVENPLLSISAPGVRPKQQSDDAALETQATAYARWLADRDGVTLPSSLPAAPIWSDASNGTRGRRISAVSFGDVLVNIPNWDWTPTKPVRGLA